MREISSVRVSYTIESRVGQRVVRVATINPAPNWSNVSTRGVDTASSQQFTPKSLCGSKLRRTVLSPQHDDQSTVRIGIDADGTANTTLGNRPATG
jgi:hypothetical protein